MADAICDKTNGKEFGINEAVWIDNSGIYPIGVDIGYSFLSDDSLLHNDNTFAITPIQHNFPLLYHQLNDWQLRARLLDANLL